MGRPSLPELYRLQDSLWSTLRPLVRELDVWVDEDARRVVVQVDREDPRIARLLGPYTSRRLVRYHPLAS